MLFVTATLIAFLPPSKLMLRSIYMLSKLVHPQQKNFHKTILMQEAFRSLTQQSQASAQEELLL